MFALGAFGMLEFRVLECWNGSGLLALDEVRFANGLTLFGGLSFFAIFGWGI